MEKHANVGEMNGPHLWRSVGCGKVVSCGESWRNYEVCNLHLKWLVGERIQMVEMLLVNLVHFQRSDEWPMSRDNRIGSYDVGPYHVCTTQSTRHTDIWSGEAVVKLVNNSKALPFPLICFHGILCNECCWNGNKLNERATKQNQQYGYMETMMADGFGICSSRVLVNVDLHFQCINSIFQTMKF